MVGGSGITSTFLVLNTDAHVGVRMGVGVGVDQLQDAVVGMCEHPRVQLLLEAVTPTHNGEGSVEGAPLEELIEGGLVKE